MIGRIARRTLGAVVTLACVYTLTFAMVIGVAGNPFQTGERNMPQEAEQALRARYHMDDNWAYFREYLAGVVRLDFGPAFTYADWTCNQIIAASLPVSATLGALAVVIAVLVGVPLGVVSAARKKTGMDQAVSFIVLTGVCVPTFVIGAALVTVFAVWLRWLPIGGWGTWRHLPLPALTLSLPIVAYVTRLVRAGMLDVLESDFIRTARAKGLPPRAVIWRHAFKPAFLPVLGYLGPAAAQAMTGSFVVEKVFGVPGLGQHFVNAALNRDPGLMMGAVLVFAALLIALNILVDVLYAWVDPRISSSL
ncbi:MAG: ABC transporter permease subunit [Planctomycetota bacterium]